MRNNKGFTLIELLAVIVILAIIALIVTPVVSNIITSSRNSANARSVEGHIDNVKYGILQNAFNAGSDIGAGDGTFPKTEQISSGKIESTTQRDTVFNGIDFPDNDTIYCETYRIKNGIVEEATNCKSADWNKTFNYTSTGGAKAN
ncbi:MAG: prepilin-type N-terminal cleavage/methylation domain-containing protein [Bacilli bacterium]|nr:prepilin-type N-terminal cleavage/methylation domain-containing protein [Bacilli bacterium]